MASNWMVEDQSSPAATGKDDVICRCLDQFQGVTDAVGRGRTGGADGVVDTLYLERVARQAEVVEDMGTWHHVGTRRLTPFHGRYRQIRRCSCWRRRRNRSRCRYALLETISLPAGRHLDGLLHGEVGVSRGVTHETLYDFTVDQFRRIDLMPPQMAAQVCIA